MKPLRFRELLFLFLVPTLARGQGLVPPPGTPVPPQIRSQLEEGVGTLGRAIGALRESPDPMARAHWPDVAVLHKAVDWALRYDEFHSTNQFDQARQLLQFGLERAGQLRSGRAPWTTSTGLVVRGFVSRIDGSVQPYGVVVPTNWNPGGKGMRLDVWLAGRDERRTELKFLAERLRSRGEFAPENTVVVHPYGRFCNAYKFAGETDVFEAVAAAERAYGTDPGRRAIRGFSMGGAGTWHLAAHHPWYWRGAAPGAGFVDTANYTGILSTIPPPPEWEQTLWRLYDVPGYALNLRLLDVIAYSGERDKQRLAADTMVAAAREVGVELDHIIGPGVEHRYEPGAKQELARRFDARMSVPRDPAPKQVEFTTFTLKYPDEGRVAWVQVLGLEQHWKPTHVRAIVESPSRVLVLVTNVSAVRLEGVPGLAPGRVHVRINGQDLDLKTANGAGSSLDATFELNRGKWRRVATLAGNRKRPGLQGPIDDAFTGPFLVVRPTGKPWSAAIGAWADKALGQFIVDWRGQFRGDVRLKDDTAVTDSDIREYNLILWGDPGSNRLLGRVALRLPLRWTRDTVELARTTYPAATHLPALIAPNPLNPNRYVVLNSGHTFARWNGTNARQTPWLPDWAVMDISTTDPTGIPVAAGFFGEDWRAH